MSWQEIVKQKNIEASEVPLSCLFGSNRIDAECYQKKFLNNESSIKGKNTIEISRIAKITDGDHSKFPDNQEQEVRYIRSKDIKNYCLVDDDPVFVSGSYFQKLKRSQIEEENILISIMGNVGDITITPKGFKSCIANRAICILKNIEINPYFLFVYLISNTASLDIERLKTGGVQERINLEILQQLHIPMVTNTDFINIIQNLIINSQQSQNSSMGLLKQAEHLLLSELGLADYVPDQVNTSTRDLFECLQDDRFDAEYWMPKYDEIQKRVARVPQSKLGQLVTHKKGIEVGSEAYQEEGEDFIRVADFSIFGIEGVEKKISNELYENLKKNYQPKKGEVLFTKDGTIGLSYALDADIKGILSGAFLRLQPKSSLNTHYLALVLNSLYCKYQIERMSGGAIIAHLKPESAMQINIPILSQSKQDELGNMVIQSQQKRNEAKKLLEKAKRAVEIFIEQDEEKALAFLAS